MMLINISSDYRFTKHMEELRNNEDQSQRWWAFWPVDSYVIPGSYTTPLQPLHYLISRHFNCVNGVFSYRIFLATFLTVLNWLLCWKSRAHADAIRIHDDNDDAAVESEMTHNNLSCDALFSTHSSHF